MSADAVGAGMMRLASKVAVVTTGGTSGISAVTGRLFARYLE
jgi:hypothetical protein